jgi:hypothetical protein
VRRCSRLFFHSFFVPPCVLAHLQASVLRYLGMEKSDVIRGPLLPPLLSLSAMRIYQRLDILPRLLKVSECAY